MPAAACAALRAAYAGAAMPRPRIATRASLRLCGARFPGFPLRRAFHVSLARLFPSKFHMPAMSPTMTEGSITKWLKREGEAFSAGDILLEIETDKAQIEVEAAEDGFLAKVLVPAGTGQKVAVNEPIAVIAEDESELSQKSSVDDEQRASSEEKAQSSGKNLPSSTSPSPAHSNPVNGATAAHGRAKAPAATFPSVARLLAEYHLDASAVKPSGPKGNLLKGDVLKHIKGSNLVKTARPTSAPAKQRRDTITGCSTVPRFVMTQDISLSIAGRSDADAAMICAISRALRSVPDLNIRRVRNPLFSANDADDLIAASEFLRKPGTDVDVVLHRDAAVAPHSSPNDVLFRNADRAGAELKGPVTMDVIEQYKNKDAADPAGAVRVIPASTGVFEWSPSSAAAEPTIVTISRNLAIRDTDRRSSADIIEYLTRPSLSRSSAATPRSRADEIDVLSAPAGAVPRAAPSAAASAATGPTHTLRFSFDSTMVDPAVAGEFCEAVAREAAAS